MNSSYRKTVISDTRIFDIWSLERGQPAFLNMGDYTDIVESGKLFARKVSQSIDSKLCLRFLKDF